MAQLLSLWRQWQEGRALPSDHTPWRDVFALLRALRPWGPADRVADEDRDVLLEEIDGRADDETVRLEIELVFRPGLEHCQRTEADLAVAFVEAGGRALHRSLVDSIAYHAVLTELPVPAVRAIAARGQASIVGLDQVVHVRPQAVSFSIDTAEASSSPGFSALLSTAAPIAALLDGVPVLEHPLLAGRLRVRTFSASSLAPKSVIAGTGRL